MLFTKRYFDGQEIAGCLAFWGSDSFGWSWEVRGAVLGVDDVGVVVEQEVGDGRGGGGPAAQLGLPIGGRRMQCGRRGYVSDNLHTHKE